MAQGTMDRTDTSREQGIYPIANEDYNLIAAAAKELEGLETFQRYSRDSQHGEGRFWQNALDLKKQLAELFTHEIAEHAAEGCFGSGEKRSR